MNTEYYEESCRIFTSFEQVLETTENPKEAVWALFALHVKLLELLDEVAMEDRNETFDKKFEIVRDALASSTTQLSNTLNEL
jgi:hypothetical protein